MVEIDDITGVIVDASVKIHRDLGSCLFESVYELALSTALQRRGLRVVRQQPIGFVYEDIEFEHCFRADLSGVLAVQPPCPPRQSVW
jgi:iron complex transport system substrate-binding protein